jgi:hypothetical protein
MALSLIVGGVVIHMESSLECLSKPLNGNAAHVIIKATPVAEIDSKYPK